MVVKKLILKILLVSILLLKKLLFLNWVNETYLMRHIYENIIGLIICSTGGFTIYNNI